MQLGEYVTHPIADVWPVMEGKKLDEFVEDMRVNGQINDIWRWRKDGSILDGRNRLIGCMRLGIEPRFAWYEGDDPLGFIRSQNAHRRHETWSVQCVVAARLATFAPGRPTKTAGARGLSQAAAAAATGVKPSAVRETVAMLKTADPALVEAFEREEVTLERAGELAKLEPAEQRERLAELAAERAERTKTRAVKKATAAIANDEKTPPHVQLVRIVKSALEKAGATIMVDHGNVHIGYHGNVYLLQLQQQPKRSAA